jgi:hypothetical protein
MMSFLLTAGILALFGWLILRVRSKLRQAREAALAREAAFLGDLGGAQARVSPAASTARRTTEGAGLPRGTAGAAAGVRLAAAYLSPAAGGALRHLRAALPEHEIFPRASLQRILGPLAPGKDLEVDFLVCDLSFRPVAVVDLMGPEDLPPVVALKAERLAAAGVAYARWDGGALPEAAAVAAALLGGKR